MTKAKGTMDLEVDLDRLSEALEELDLGDDLDIEVDEELEEEKTKEEDEKPKEQHTQGRRGRPKKEAATAPEPPPAKPLQNVVPEDDLDDPKTLLLAALRVHKKVIEKSTKEGAAKEAALEVLHYVEGLIDLLL